MDPRSNKKKTIKLLEENIWGKLFDLGLGEGILDMTLKASIKKNLDKLGLFSFLGHGH